jgi:hypothetical protein
VEFEVPNELVRVPAAVQNSVTVVRVETVIGFPVVSSPLSAPRCQLPVVSSPLLGYSSKGLFELGAPGPCLIHFISSREW